MDVNYAGGGGDEDRRAGKPSERNCDEAAEENLEFNAEVEILRGSAANDLASVRSSSSLGEGTVPP